MHVQSVKQDTFLSCRVLNLFVSFQSKIVFYTIVKVDVQDVQEIMFFKTIYVTSSLQDVYNLEMESVTNVLMDII